MLIVRMSSTKVRHCTEELWSRIEDPQSTTEEPTPRPEVNTSLLIIIVMMDWQRGTGQICELGCESEPCASAQCIHCHPFPGKAHIGWTWIWGHRHGVCGVRTGHWSRATHHLFVCRSIRYDLIAVQHWKRNGNSRSTSYTMSHKNAITAEGYFVLATFAFVNYVCKI